MRKPPHSAAAEKSRARVIIIDPLKLQMLRLMALRKEVAAAERANAAATRKKHKQAHLLPSPRRAVARRRRTP